MAKGASHAEVWDDSALVNSWNEALEEYKKYHSLAAKGEKVELVLDRVEKGEVETGDLEGVNANNSADVPVLVNGNSTSSTNSTNRPVEEGSLPTGAQPLTTTQAMPAASATAAVPQMLLNQVQDDGLKNVMMSWYYAGYYTGLYEGQQKAHAGLQQGG
ncbi:hypothetical protein LTR56_012265 [Elasticomyces elasticus]|nr:hypothetical protein LTR22_021030 [Elasticomyces elasticus]KAK3639690.1 hypothetical protein LTR56_012265 [Elasticomyces elasticus]KAK4922552.1 hypothetical protein LTR49_010077 [Elasticomyces elasticus]KAK5760725.1 hypothetical protein LTS12_009081 [Elasticomyces elasticus]